MGNSNSQQLSAERRAQQQWAHSFPRAAPPHKVLPERVPGRRLRVTDNGAILHSGGTISGRRHSPAPCSDDEQPSERYRSRSSSNHRQRAAPPQPHHQPFKAHVKRFGSEPDLRNPTAHKHSPAKQRISRTRKKYKAPAPPPDGDTYGLDSSSPDSCHWESLEPPARRLRLFKTREETKKRGGPEPPRPAPVVPRLSTPEFQAELLRAARRLRPTTPVDRGDGSSKGSGRASSRDDRVESTGRAKMRDDRGNGAGRAVKRDERGDSTGRAMVRDDRVESTGKAMMREIRGDGSGRASSREDLEAMTGRTASREEPATRKERVEVPRRTPTREARGDGSGRTSTPPRSGQDSHWDLISPRPTKTFYFGMEQGERDAVDRFAASLQRLPAATASGSGDSLSSDLDDVDVDGSIALQLRPMLPKKQLEIPRFSPTAAWRLLSALESPSSPLDEAPAVMEERIQRMARPMAPPLPAALLQDKSGDSGISGDASPGGGDAAAWTPQQDLGEESSSDGGGSMHGEERGEPRFSPRAQVFSLSLPRDDRLCLALCTENKQKPGFNSLKKLKRSVSGAFTALNTPTKVKEDDRLLDENWLLSRSACTSLRGAQPTSSGSQPSTTPDREPRAPPAFSYLASGGHVMYLPAPPAAARTRSKSCENMRAPSPDLRADLTDLADLADLRHEAPKRGRSRKFTFQSTVRQLERRRISERLSREAELEERRRRGELEAMRRVEEEFQRKRAPEKANIRHQLRLFSLDERALCSLPAGWTRAEPDGAASSPTSSPDPAAQRPTLSTQVLSEYREPTRDYRDYRPSRFPESGPEAEKRATVHPSAVFDMPKTTAVFVAPLRQPGGSAADERSSTSDNYRREFAHGALRSLSSDSEPSRPASRLRSRSPSPVVRSRHGSPAPRSRHDSPVVLSRDDSPAPRSRNDSPVVRSRSISLSPVRRSKNNSPAPTGRGRHDSPVVRSQSRSPVQDGRSRNDSPAPDGRSTGEDPSQAQKMVDDPCAAAKRLCFTTVQPFAKTNKGFRPIAFNLGVNPAQNVAQLVV